MTQSKSNTKRAPAQAPQKAQGITHPKTKKEKNLTNTGQNLLLPTTLTHSSKWGSNQLAAHPMTFVLKRFLSGKTLKKFRKAHKLSARELGIELGVSRAYIKQIEGGSKPASQKLIKRFDALRENMGEDVAPPVQEPETRSIVSKHKLPQSFEILVKPARCKTCRAYFVGTPQQKYCGTRCAKLGRKAQAQAKRKRAANALPKRSKRATAAKRKPAPPRVTAQRTAPKPTNARRAVVSKTRGGKQ